MNNTSNKNTFGANQSHCSKVLPIITVNSTDNGDTLFDLKKFDSDSLTRSKRLNSSKINKEIVIVDSQQPSFSVNESQKLTEHTETRSRTLEIHTTGPFGPDSEDASISTVNKEQQVLIPISVEKSEQSDSEMTKAIEENLEGYVQFKVDQYEGLSVKE